MSASRYSLALLFALAPLALQAARPTIIVNGDPPDITVVTNTSFGFGANPSGGGDFSFQNETGQVWLQLDIFVTLPASITQINCGTLTFGTCTFSSSPVPGTSNLAYDITFGPNPQGGIRNGETFSINLNDDAINNTDPNGVGQWGPNRDFDAVANDAVPEPASWMLIALGFVGLGGVYIYRRRASSV